MPTSLRGMADLEIMVGGASTDLHSGMHCIGKANPKHVLSHIFASMKDLNGNITVHGFYKDVKELSAEYRLNIEKFFLKKN